MKLLFSFITLMCMFFYRNSHARPVKYSFTITVVTRLSVEDDSLFLSLSPSFFKENDGEENIYAAHGTRDGRYVFQVNAAAPYGYFSISQKPPAGDPFHGRRSFIPFISDYFWETGDDVTIVVSAPLPESTTMGGNYDYQCSYTGAGFSKYEVKDKLDSTRNISPDYHLAYWTDTTNSSFHDPYSFQINASLQVLDAARASIPDFYYQLCKADVITASYGIRSYFFRLKLGYDQLPDKPMAKQHFIEAYNRSMINRLAIPVSPDVSPESSRYIEFICQKVNFDNYIKYGYENPDANFKAITANFTGKLRDRALVKALMIAQGSEHVDTLYQYAATLIRDSVSLRMMGRLRSKMPGLPAYDFRLQDTKGKYHKLSDYKGKTVFIDMWFTGCGACAAIYTDAIKQAEEQLGNESGVQFISICVDTNKNTWMKSIGSGKYTSGRAVNLYTNGEGFRHEMMQYYGINALPSLMIVRPDGKIHRFYYNRLAKDLESAAALVKTLKAVGGM
jgi:cytochrome oxidase Cu insertion factor (SCO1/SenC/PrrC family)